jgi:hypothetical protein
MKLRFGAERRFAGACNAPLQNILRFRHLNVVQALAPFRLQ